MSQLTRPSIDLGLEFLKHSSQCKSTNVLLSPLSIFISYCMVLEGAAGETEKQIKKVLNLDKIDSQHGDISRIIKRIIESYRISESDGSEQKCMLEFGNLLMANKEYKFREDYVQSMMANYFADAFNEDFEEGQNILGKVNSWVSKSTRNKITTILEKPPTPDDVLLLVNTIYFEGKWVKPFSSDDTQDSTFNNADGTTVETKMMTFSGERFNYVERLDKKLQIVEIPYVGNISMILILPTQDNNLKKMIDNLDSTELSSLIDSMRETRLDNLTIPKFKLEDNYELHKILPSMGMTLPFNMLDSEFPKITERSLPLYISQSIQKAVIEVSEEGTTALSATAVVFKNRSFVLPSLEKITFIADRPFMFFIRDEKTGVNIFMGQLSNMTDKQFL